MAIAVEAVSGVSGTGASSLTVTGFTVTAANLMLIGVSMGDGTAAAAQTFSVVWNGAGSATQVASSGATDGTWASVVWYRLNSPAAATGNLVVSFQIGGSASNPNQSAVHVITFTGADTTLGTPSTNTGTSTNPSVTVADSASGEIVVALNSNDNEGGTTQANSLIFEVEGLGGDTDHNSQYKTATGANTAMSWTNGGSGNGWAASGLAIAASGGGGGGGASGRDLMLMGVGA